MSEWFNPTVILWIFTVAFTSDLIRALFEVVVNFSYRDRKRPTVLLGRSDVAVVIPCHNSASSIEDTIDSMPEGLVVYCVANNCTDQTVAIIEALAVRRPGIRLIDVDFDEGSKSKAVILGVAQARRDGFSHALLTDDDISWPAGRPIEVLDRAAAVTALPVLPEHPETLLERFQVFEYIGNNLNKRVQLHFGRNVTWASGAAAVYRTDVFLKVMREHDGEFAGEDIQCSYLHHYFGYRIDFVAEGVVRTAVPRTPAEWWRQRAHCWDVSFMFLHLPLLLRVLFRAAGKGPGWWIRLMTFYRIYDAVLVLVKLGLPFAMLRAPAVAGVFVLSSYMILAIQYVSYPVFFPAMQYPSGMKRRSLAALAFVVFPLYTFAIWVSRLAAVPRVIQRQLNPKPKLGAFIDTGFAGCTRVGGTGARRSEAS